MISDKNQKKFALTTPLYYVNGLPHLGSAYTTMVADVIARWQRLQGHEVLLITGTDEHGQKIERTALSQGIAPDLYCDQIVKSFTELWSKLNIQCDRFIRTTNPRHQAIVNAFLEKVWQRGDIYLNQQQGWYCVACEEFKEKRELSAEGYCPIHTNQKAEWRDEENYFFRLSKYQVALEQMYQDNLDFIQPESRRNEVLSFVKQGLQDFSISRINVEWAFPIPRDPRHTLYVWFDALLGYVSALLGEDQEPTLENAFSHWWPINLHLIGKDILRFHAVYWPAMLLSAGYPLPERVFSHGFLTKDGQKMGKSLGNTLDPLDLVERYGADALRYYFLKEVELGRDGDFSETRFVNILNADLANDLGNLLNRTLGMVRKYCHGQCPTLSIEDLPENNTLKIIGVELSSRVIMAYDALQFPLACEEIFTLIRAGNKFIDENAPWSLFKQGKQLELEQLLYAVLESIRLCAYLLSPIIPGLSSKIYQQLGFLINFNDFIQVNHLAPFSEHSQWGIFLHREELSQPEPIFSKLELPEVNL
jgi:methionyl-tRNA synthetase